MPVYLAVHTPQGLQELPDRPSDLEAAARFEPPGVYTVGRTYGRDRVVLLEAHFDRLEESARLAGVTVRLDRDALRASLRQAVRRAGFPESRFRLTLPLVRPEQVYLAVERLPLLPPHVRQAGVAVATVPLRRPEPRLKTNDWLQERAQIRRRLPAGVYEAVLLDEAGRLLEGLSSNFYGVLEGRLWTAEEMVLPGIARRIVLEVAPQVLPVRLEALSCEHLPRLEEALLSSSSRGVVPVVRVDGCVIGEGRPGPCTRAIAEAYETWVETHLEPL